MQCISMLAPQFSWGFSVLKIQQQVGRTSAGMMPDRSARVALAKVLIHWAILNSLITN
jgi:hypothetical protein